VVQPSNGFNSTNYSHFLDVNITSWTSSLMNWSEYSNDSNLNTSHTICSLTPGNIYDVYYTKNNSRTKIGRYTVNSNGCISFDYSEGYSTVFFEVDYYGTSSVGTNTNADSPSGSSGKVVVESNSKNESLKVKKNYEIEFEFKNETKILRVDWIYSDRVNFSIDGKKYSVYENSFVEIDLNDDGFYDVEIYNKNVYGSVVSLEFTLINEEVPSDVQDEVDENVKDDVKDAIENGIKTNWYVYVGVLLVIVLIVVLVLLKRK